MCIKNWLKFYKIIKKNAAFFVFLKMNTIKDTIASGMEEYSEQANHNKQI